MAVDLRKRRKELGLTMKQVADAVGVSEATISRYESGNIRNMRRDRIDKYAKILRVNLLSLIPLEEWSRPEEPELNEEVLYMTVGERLKNARISKGLKVADMTKLLNISDRGYRFYESGEREPNIECLIKICRILSVSADELLGITGDDELRKEPTMITHLQKIRMEKGISMRKAAMDMGLPYTTYVSYEKGEREPNIAGLIKLADYFGCTVDYLVRGEAPREAPGTIPEAARDHIMRRFCNTV